MTRYHSSSRALGDAPKTSVKTGNNASEQEQEMLLTQASICCEQARQAAAHHRFQAACGLFSTAIMLYRLLLRDDQVQRNVNLYQQIEEQISYIEKEKALHAALGMRWRYP